MAMPEFARGKMIAPQPKNEKTEQDFFREDIHEFVKKKDEERKQQKEQTDGN
jgi:hypothetical protein